ncbi:MAG: methionine biosynthesis protein MetW, partial [Chloroflexota bacterium]
MLPLDRQNTLREQYRRRHPQWRPATEVYAELVRQNLRPDSRVLDLGCGRGGLVEQLEHPLRLIAGVDPDHRSLREHRLPLPCARAI